jgi:hypothetical protein
MKPAVDLPTVDWTTDDFIKLLELGFPVPSEIMNACAERPRTWVPSTTVFERAGVEPPSGRGQVAGFGYSVRTRFSRCNPPWEAQWQAGGDHVIYYRVDDPTSESWLKALAAVSDA